MNATIKAMKARQTTGVKAKSANDLSKYENYVCPSAAQLADKLVEIDKAQQTNKPLKRLTTDLTFQPVTYILCIHLRNLLTSNISKTILTRHISNLEFTYGSSEVKSCMQSFFPEMHKGYYAA